MVLSEDLSPGTGRKGVSGSWEELRRGLGRPDLSTRLEYQEYSERRSDMNLVEDDDSTDVSSLRVSFVISLTYLRDVPIRVSFDLMFLIL